MPPLLIIGYGNTLRNDDGVGPWVAGKVAALALPGVETIECALLTPEIAEPVSRAEAVVFVDAAVDAPQKVRLSELAPAGSSQVMAHAADPRTVLALARDVFGRAPKAWLLTIPIENLALGEELSATARSGAAEAVEAIRKLAAGMPGGKPARFLES
jgi:hydrogenase maturation protease